MPTYISILRGINVSGKKKILMADLRALYENIGFTDVKSYIQSGNLAFGTNKEESNQALEEKIAGAIAENYPFEVPILVRRKEEIEATLANNPFAKEADIDIKKLHVTFLAQMPAQDRLDLLAEVNYPPDRFEINGQDIFIHCPNRYGETKLSNTFFERKLKVSATTRNWKTVNKLWEMVSG